MRSTQDSFWKIFTITVVALATGTVLYVYAADEWVRLDTVRDETLTLQRQVPRTLSVSVPFEGKIYQDGLEHGIDDWSWGATLNLAAAGDTFKGPRALKVDITEPYGALNVHIPTTSPTTYYTLTFAVKNAPPSTRVLLFDRAGRQMGSEPLSWYTKGKTDTWQQVQIPLVNLGALNRAVGSVAFTSSEAYSFLLDEITLDTFEVVHDPAPREVEVETSFAIGASPLPYAPLLTEADGTLWKAVTGFLKTGGGGIELGVKKQTEHESFAVYTKGANWGDYRAEADLTWMGESFSMSARYKDANDYVACAFNNRALSVQLYRAEPRNYRLLGETPELPYYNQGIVQRVGISVQGNTVTCLVNGDVVLQATVPMSSTGTIAFGTWSRVDGAHAFKLNNLVVTPLN